MLIEKVIGASQEFAASSFRQKKSKKMLAQSPKKFFLDDANGDSKPLRNVTTRVSHVKTLNCMLRVGPPPLHHYCAVVLHSCIVLPPVGHSSNHQYHCFQLTDNRAAFRIFIALLRFSFDCPSYLPLNTMPYTTICMYLHRYCCENPKYRRYMDIILSLNCRL